MIPQIFQLGPLPINSFGLMVALAIVASGIILAKSFKINDINPELAEKYILTGGIVGLIGARLWFIFIDNFSELKDQLFEALTSSAGFTFHGGFIIGSTTLIVMTKLDKIPLNKFLDSMGPCLALAYAIGRLGCQLSGDGDYGIETSSFLGMSFSTGVIPTPIGVNVFPTPLYESFLCILIVFILLKLEKNKSWLSVPYARAGAYLTLIGTERFIVEFLRVNPKVFYIFSQSQIIYAVVIILGLILLFNKLCKKSPTTLST